MELQVIEGWRPIVKGSKVNVVVYDVQKLNLSSVSI